MRPRGLCAQLKVTQQAGLGFLAPQVQFGVVVSAPRNLDRAAHCQHLPSESLSLGKAFKIPAEGLSLAPPRGESLLGAVPGGVGCGDQRWGPPEQGRPRSAQMAALPEGGKTPKSWSFPRPPPHSRS